MGNPKPGFGPQLHICFEEEEVLTLFSSIFPGKSEWWGDCWDRLFANVAIIIWFPSHGDSGAIPIKNWSLFCSPSLWLLVDLVAFIDQQKTKEVTELRSLETVPTRLLLQSLLSHKVNKPGTVCQPQRPTWIPGAGGNLAESSSNGAHRK